MKQNTKFLWMYILILFSFALILIVFAGFSQYTQDEEEKGLRAEQKGLSQNVAELSEENTQLKDKIKELETQKTTLSDENKKMKTENDSLKKIDTDEDANDALLIKALQARDIGDEITCNEIIASIDSHTLTEIQLYIYNSLKAN